MHAGSTVDADTEESETPADTAEAAQTAVPVHAAELLVGLDLNDGWKVVEKARIAPDATGGMHTVGYLAERNRQRNNKEHGFVKALDLRATVNAAREMDIPIVDAIQQATRRHTFERDLVMQCAGNRMRNVVVGFTYGEIRVEDPRVDPILNEVPYIVFERAEGDVRKVIAEKLRAFDDAWRLRILHGVANGIHQLHRGGVAHQDLKPSNVMTFPGDVGKVGDLGHAWTEEGGGLFDSRLVTGDTAYAPPELLYGHAYGDDQIRRRAVDTYHLGSLVVNLFTGAGLTALLENELGPTFHWRTWPRDYANVLPYVRDAFNRILDKLSLDLAPHLAADVVELIRRLCDPDPLLRGDGVRGPGPERYAMERFITRFDLLARRAEVALAKSTR